MKKSEKRFYRFDVQRNFQFETHDKDGNLISNISESEWREKVEADLLALFAPLLDAHIIEVIYAFHDKDINDDGTSKGLHVHFIATFESGHNKTQTAAIKLFGASSVHNCAPCDSYCDSVRYLAHISEGALNACKHVYPLEEVKGWRINAEDGKLTALTLADVQEAMSRKGTKKQRKEQNKVRSACISAIMNGNTTVSSVRPIYTDDVQNVGLDAVKLLDDDYKLRKAQDIWLERITEYYQSNPCPMLTIYISGGGGTGKTTLANAIADRYADIHGIHKVAAPGRGTTFDFAGNYKGERVSVFNELAPAFTVEQFLSIFDPLNAMLVNSRNVDRFYFFQKKYFFS